MTMMGAKRCSGAWLAALAATGLALLAGGCGGGASDQRLAAESDAAGPDPSAAAEAGPPMAFDFTLDTLSGDSFRLSDATGQVRLIDFWATWCAPCREEIPMLNELQASYGERGFKVLAISDPEEELGLIREFVEQHEVEYLNLVGTEEVNAAYQVLGLPAAYLVDGEGRVVDSFMGPKPRRVLVEKIEALLEGAPTT
jgi:thiol-disulfide isomerase/thioredoxin